MPSSPAATASSQASHASSPPSSSCFGAAARSVSGDSTTPICSSSNRLTSSSAGCAPRAADLGDVAVVGAAAAAEHVDPRQLAAQGPVASAQVDGVAGVQPVELVQLGV